MKCKEHPKYQARRMPMKTAKYPDGCPTCLGIWENAKTDPKRLAKTVTIELDHDEARAMALSLDALLSRGGKEAARTGQTLRPLIGLLTAALRNA